jgi:hypothetical protein
MILEIHLEEDHILQAVVKENINVVILCQTKEAIELVTEETAVVRMISLRQYNMAILLHAEEVRLTSNHYLIRNHVADPVVIICTRVSRKVGKMLVHAILHC